MIGIFRRPHLTTVYAQRTQTPTVNHCHGECFLWPRSWVFPDETSNPCLRLENPKYWVAIITVLS